MIAILALYVVGAFGALDVYETEFLSFEDCQAAALTSVLANRSVAATCYVEVSQ